MINFVVLQKAAGAPKQMTVLVAGVCGVYTEPGASLHSRVYCSDLYQSVAGMVQSCPHFLSHSCFILFDDRRCIFHFFCIRFDASCCYGLTWVKPVSFFNFSGLFKFQAIKNMCPWRLCQSEKSAGTKIQGERCLWKIPDVGSSIPAAGADSGRGASVQAGGLPHGV